MTRETHWILLTWVIKAKKNSYRARAFWKFAKIYKPKDFKAWEQSIFDQLRDQNLPKLWLKKCELHYKYWLPDKRKRDLNNMTASVNDLLTEYGFIEDDNYRVVVKETSEFMWIEKWGRLMIEVLVIPEHAEKGTLFEE